MDDQGVRFFAWDLSLRAGRFFYHIFGRIETADSFLSGAEDRTGVGIIYANCCLPCGAMRVPFIYHIRLVFRVNHAAKEYCIVFV